MYVYYCHGRTYEKAVSGALGGREGKLGLKGGPGHVRLTLAVLGRGLGRGFRVRVTPY